jgi:hypothetical protein
MEWIATSNGMSSHFDLPLHKTPLDALRHSAIQIHAWFVFSITKDHSSSNSRTLASASFASGMITISLRAVSFASYTLGRDISASHWEHDRCVQAHCIRSGTMNRDRYHDHATFHLSPVSCSYSLTSFPFWPLPSRRSYGLRCLASTAMN